MNYTFFYITVGHASVEVRRGESGFGPRKNLYRWNLTDKSTGRTAEVLWTELTRDNPVDMLDFGRWALDALSYTEQEPPDEGPEAMADLERPRPLGPSSDSYHHFSE